MMEKNDLISRAAALDVLVTSPNFHTTLTRIEELPTVYAIPVEWLKKMRDDDRLTIDDVETIDLILAWWQKEQEAHGT